MKKVKKTNLVILLALFVIFGFGFDFNTLKVEAATAFEVSGGTQVKRLPRGTRMEVKAVDAVTTENVETGSVFSAVLINNIRLERQMVLPEGSLVRGSVQEIKPAKRLSRSAVLYLDFDHIVTPSGRQLPIHAALCSNFKLTKDGGITTGGGLGYALGQTWDKSVGIVTNATKWGISAGSELFTGGQYILTPIAAVGGLVGGAGYLMIDSVADFIRKGDEIIINQGQQFDILLLEPLDVPVY